MRRDLTPLLMILSAVLFAACLVALFRNGWFWHPLGQCAGASSNPTVALHEATRCKSYNLHSGLGANLAYVGMSVSVALGAWRVYRKHTECHVSSCSKHGHVVHGTPYRACHDHDARVTHAPGERITAAHIAEAHANAQTPA